MTPISIRSYLTGATIAALGLALAACNGTTYGTGVSPGQQTLEDIAGIAALGSPKKDPIRYTARPAIVAPPPGAPLPVPGSEDPSLAANWPKDPDEQAKKFKADVAEREALCAANNTAYYCQQPNFALPPKAPPQEPNLIAMQKIAGEEAHSNAAQDAAAKKLFADSRGLVAVDADGKPIRQYLSDPPPEYREPDPTAPVEIENKPAVKKKFKWPWE